MTEYTNLDEQDAKDSSAFARYRIMAFITGAFLLLLTVEMILKYAFQAAGVDSSGSAKPVMGNWIAFVHGWIYVIYLITVFDMWSRLRWGLGRMFTLIIAGVVPVLSFVMEPRAKAWFEESLTARRAAYKIAGD